MATFTASGERLPGLALKFLLTLALHGALLYWTLQAMPGRAVPPDSAPMPIQAVLIPPPSVAPALAQPAAKPVPRPAVRPVPRNAPKPAPTAILTAAGGSTAMASAPAAPAAATTPAAAAPVATVTTAATPAAPPALEPARFDADYLNNPAPAYPLLSRRQGETGKVLLQVQVTAHGTAGQVEIKQGSGFPRLDEAALNAVRKWRFVPARRGDAAVAASVVVPITFRLDG
ncbi:energy transducer TonB [Herminiimonas sp. CN]|uniref:energy transducer TonB n=1 Tax=Herminiimonas sp. CN TaxID=1349818 RepID=UPI000473CC0B|nr:energy transducer TonB [Herminiimonas sp. CN]